MSLLAPPLMFLSFSLVLLEALVGMNLIPSYIVPPPHAWWAAFSSDPGMFIKALLETLSATAWGFAASLVFGVLGAFVFSLSPLVRRAVYPYLVFFQTVPIVAIAPLLVIWFGFGSPTVRVSTFIVSVFPILASTLSGLQSASRERLELFQAFRATPWQTTRYLLLPSSLPIVFSGARIGAGLAVVGAIVGEFIAGGGLGSLIDSARTQQRTDIVFVSLILSAFLGFFMVSLVDLTRLMLARWRPFF